MGSQAEPAGTIAYLRRFYPWPGLFSPRNPLQSRSQDRVGHSSQPRVYVALGSSRGCAAFGPIDSSRHYRAQPKHYRRNSGWRFFQGKQFRMSDLSRPARRAWSIPQRTRFNSPVLCESVEIEIRTPAAAALRAFSAERSSRSGLELISKKQPLSRACVMTRSMSIS